MWATNSLGGFYSNNELSRELRTVAQPAQKHRQFVQVKGAKGSKRGDLLFFDKNYNIVTAGGTLVETSTIPSTNFTIARGTLTITEYGNSIPYSGKLEALSEFDVENTILVALKNDMGKVLDSQAAIQFTSADLKAVNTASGAAAVITANGTATVTATANLTAVSLRSIVDDARKRNIPFYDGNNYVCIGSVELLSGFHADTGSSGWISVSQYTMPQAERIFRGEIGSFYMTRFVEETNFHPNTIGSGNRGAGVLFGADAVMEGVAIPEEIRAKVPADFGRDQALAWYALLGWQKIWNDVTDGDERIYHITSA